MLSWGHRCFCLPNILSSFSCGNLVQMVCSGLPPCDLGLVTECIPPARDQILVQRVIWLLESSRCCFSHGCGEKNLSLPLRLLAVTLPSRRYHLQRNGSVSRDSSDQPWISLWTHSLPCGYYYCEAGNFTCMHDNQAQELHLTWVPVGVMPSDLNVPCSSLSVFYQQG